MGEFEEPDSGTTILVKAHRPIDRADAAVLLIRNPFDAILAEFNRNHGGGHTGHASEKFLIHHQFSPKNTVRKCASLTCIQIY